MTATNKNADEDVLSNYKIGGDDAVSGSKYDVTSEGKITPRVIDVDLLKKTGIDKTYDGTVDAVEGDDDRKYLTMGKNWVGYAGRGRLVGDTKDSGVGTDGAKVTVKAVYRQKGTATDDKNVARAADKSVIENGKDVYYTFKLEGGNAATNYTFNADGTTPQAEKNATGTGTIDPKELKAQFNKVTRSYNNTSDVTPSQVAGKYTLTGVVSGDENKVDLNTGAIKGTYYKDGTKVKNHGIDYTVKYEGISKALVKGTAGDESGNYWIADTAEGSGDITKARLTKDSFKMWLKDRVTKVYDGTSRVRSDGLSDVQVDGTSLAAEKGYKFEYEASEYYNTTNNLGKLQAPNANVAEDGTTFHQDGANKAKAYGVKYTIRLLGDTAENYEFGDLHGAKANGGTYTVKEKTEDGKKIQLITFEKDGIGYIKSRRVYVALGSSARETPTKVYDGTTKLILKSVSSGDLLVAMGNGGQDDAGLVDASNVSKGRYQSRNAGKFSEVPSENYSQEVVYTPEIQYDEKSNGLATNYVFYHSAKDPTKATKWDPTTAPLKGRGKITPADLLVTTPNDVKRQYNGDIDVKAGQGKLTLDTPLKHESVPGKNDAATNGVRDDVHLNEIDEKKDGTGDASKYYRYYNAADANAGDSEEAKEKQRTYVTYRRIQLTGEDADNYRLVYEKDKALAKDTKNYGDNKTYYTMTGYGLIDKRKVTSKNLKIGLKTKHPEKVYDGNEYVVGKAAKEDKKHQAWNDLIERIYVEDGTEKIDVDKSHTSVTDAKYLAGGGKRAKDAADNKDVELQMNFDTSALKNFDFTDSSMANGTFTYKTTGNIKKKKVTATLEKMTDLRKVYDKTNIAASGNVKYEGVIEEDKDTAKLHIKKAQYEKKAGDTDAKHDGKNATVDPFAAAQNIYDVAYEFELTGTDAGNYELNTNKLTGSGDIERRMAFADTVHPNLMKYYDGTNDAKSYNKDTNANEDIEDKDLSNANAAKSIKLLDAAGAEFSDDRLKNRATGLLDGDTWSAKGEFDDKNAGENKKVTYKITLSDGANDNYRIYKKSDLDAKLASGAPLNNVVGTTIRTDAGKAELTDVGTVEKANLLVKADEAQKVYDGNKNTDKVEGNILSKLKLGGVYYDTTKAAVKADGAYEGTATLNHEKGKDEYRAEYRDPNVKPKDGKENAVNYSHIRLVDQANNYNLVYQTTEGIKNLEADTTAGYYKLEGKGKITPLEISDMDLNPDFKPDAIKKTYDGTKDITNAKQRLRDSKARVWVTKKGTTEKWDITDIDGAYSATGEYKDTDIGGKTLKAKDAGEKKDVTFTFTMDENNFLYNGAGGEKLKTIKKDFTGIGTITRRHVKLNVQDVQKIYDGTTDVKHGYYEGVGSDLKEHENEHVDSSKLIKAEESRTYTAEDEAANKDHKEGTLNDRGLLDGVTIDVKGLAPKYGDKKANRSPDATPEKKDVFYKLRLNGDSNENYTFEVYDGSDRLITQKDAPAEYQGYNLVGRGDIWYRKVEFNRKGLDKEYDGNAALQSLSNDAKEQEKRRKALKEKLYLQGNDGSRLSLDDEAVGKIRGTYGDGDKSRFTPNSHVKRKDGSEGTVLDRDVQLEGLYEAFKSLRDRDTEGEGARNYFYNGYGEGSKESYVAPNDFAYGTGKITPKTVKLKKTWIGGFEKPYDGTSLAKIKGADGHYYSFGEASSIGENDTEETKKIKQDVKQQFYNKLHLSVDLGTGEGAITLGYELDGGAGDDPANMPYYENPTRTTDKRDANVYNDSKLTDNKKDIVYRLKTLKSEKKYKDWEVDKGDMTARLLDGGSGYTAQITPRTIEVDAKNTAPIAKIYDGTNTVKDLLHVKGKSFDSEHPDFAYQASSGKDSKDDKPAILDKDKGTVKVVATAPAGDQAFHDRKTGAKDKNATMDAKTWEELANRKDYSAYNTENKSGKVVHYNLTLKSVQNPDNPSDADKIALGNYKLKTDTYDAAAEIVKRKVKVELDAVAPKETLTREYDGTTNADVRGLHFSSTGAPQTGVVGDEKVLLKNVDRIREEGQTNPASGLNKRRGIYDTKNVKRGANGEVLSGQHTITYRQLELNDDAVSNNYELDPSNLTKDEKHAEYGNILQAKGTITPKRLTFALEREDVQKQYDGTKEVKDNAYGKFLKENIKEHDKLWRALEEDGKEVKDFKGAFDSEDASALDANKKARADKRVTYDISWDNGNYTLLDKAGKELTKTKVDGKKNISFEATIQTEPNRGTIYRRRLEATADMARKVYDGRRDVNVRDAKGNLVKDAWNNLHFKNIDKDGNVLAKEAFLSKKDAAGRSEEQRARSLLNASYDDANATTAAEPNKLMKHEVTYSFSGSDDVLKNYELFKRNADGSHTSIESIHGAGEIERRTLHVVSDWKATYAGAGGVDFTGHIEDGSAALNGGSALTQEVAGDIRKYNDDAIVRYAPKGSVDYNTPGSQPIFGWYRDSNKEAVGNYGRNYTLWQIANPLSITPRIDGVDRAIRPDSKVYENAAYDQHNTFGKSRDQDAALSYKDKGVNDGSVKTPQANIVDGGTNLTGGAAGKGNIAGADKTAKAGRNDAGTAVNEAAKAGKGGSSALAGGASSAGVGGSAAKAAGTTGTNAGKSGNSALAGGASSAGVGGSTAKAAGTTGVNAGKSGSTANAGGYYRPSNAGAGTMGASGSSRVNRAGQGTPAVGAVDRSLAAAAGTGSASAAQRGAKVGANAANGSTGADVNAGTKAGSRSAVDQGLANALGRSGSAGYYNGKGFSQTSDDEEEEIKKKAKASA
ncbi:YDG domain-containing protein [Selenomonas sp.]|uniref:YDG domain-containing protein n=1 Tax=Selenomonas sp. TaxID=2053611 RepID=UPI003FA218B2